MAIKLDLLPEYVPLRRKLKWTVSGCIVVLGVTGVTLALFQQQQQLAYETATTNLENIKKVADLKRKAEKETTDAQTESAPMRNTIAFIYDASRTGSQRSEMLHMIRRYIRSTAFVGEIDISDGQNVLISAQVRNNQEYAAFLDNLRQGSDAQGNILFAGKPGTRGLLPYPAGNVTFTSPPPSPVPVRYTFPIDVKARGVLLNPVSVPADPVGGPAAPGGPA